MVGSLTQADFERKVRDCAIEIGENYTFAAINEAVALRKDTPEARQAFGAFLELAELGGLLRNDTRMMCLESLGRRQKLDFALVVGIIADTCGELRAMNNA